MKTSVLALTAALLLAAETTANPFRFWTEGQSHARQQHVRYRRACAGSTNTTSSLVAASTNTGGGNILVGNAGQVTNANSKSAAQQGEKSSVGTANSGTANSGTDTTGSDTTGSDTTGSGAANTLSTNTVNTANTANTADTASATGSSGAGTANNTAGTASGGATNPFCNVVFNTGAGSNPGFPTTTWATLQAAGVTDWIAFTDTKLSETASYNGVKDDPAMDSFQIPIVMDATKVQEGIALLQSANPPEYLELFNEPDYSYGGVTPEISGADAATALAPLLAVKNGKTKLLSPAPAFPTSSWLSDFFTACNCIDDIDIIAGHFYNVDVGTMASAIEQVHTKWNKPIWVTEMSPAAPGCTLDENGMITWLNQLLPQIKAMGYVEKIFWNCGEAGTATAGQCNPSLTNADGSGTALLSAYSTFCHRGS